MEPFPPNDLLDHELGPGSDFLNRPGGGQRTLCARSKLPAPLTLRVLTATRRPPKDASYTSAKPPKANGVVPHLSNVGLMKKEDGRIPKLLHNFRRCLRWCFRVL